MKLFGYEFNKIKQSPPEDVKVFDNTRYNFAKSGRYNYNEPIQEVVNDEYVYFGQDNLYPNHLNELFYASPFHSSVINFKALNLIGAGLDVIYPTTATETTKIETTKWVMRFDNQFLNQMAYDF